MLLVSVYLLTPGFLLCSISYAYGCSKFRTLHFRRFRVSSTYLNGDVLANSEAEFLFPCLYSQFVISEGKTVKTAKPGKLADPLAVAKAAKLAGTALGAAAIKAVDAVQKHGNGDEDDQVRPITQSI